MMISALILTFNEDKNIGDCISSLPWRGDVHVLDSCSSDETVSIAERLGARVHSKRFTDYADQRNFGLGLDFANDWIVCLDADERMTPGLAVELETTLLHANPDLVMLRVRRKDIFMGRWLRRSSGYPTWFPRIFRRGRTRVSRIVNEAYHADGQIGDLKEHIIHYPFNKGIDWWFERHNKYSALEAALVADRAARSPVTVSAFLGRDAARRRAALKSLAYRLPARPWIAFLYLYLVRGGFLDGSPGYQYATMRLAYEIMIDSKAALLNFEKTSPGQLEHTY